MSVCDLLLPAAETFLKMFPKTSGAETWLVRQRWRGRAPSSTGQRHHRVTVGPKRLLGDAAAGRASATSHTPQDPSRAGDPAPGPPSASSCLSPACWQKACKGPSRYLGGMCIRCVGCCGSETRENQKHCSRSFLRVDCDCKEHSTGHCSVIAERQDSKRQNQEPSVRRTKLQSASQLFASPLCFRPPPPQNCSFPTAGS